MSYQLDIEDLTHDAFQMFYDCLRSQHGTAYADFVVGAPEEVVVEKFPAKRLHSSHKNQTCVACSERINDGDTENCMFESIDDDPALFYICNPCQDEKF